MSEVTTMHPHYHVRLSRNNQTQTLPIPRELELPGTEAIIHREGKRLIIEPARPRNRLAELLASWEPMEDSLPDIKDQTCHPIMSDIGK